MKINLFVRVIQSIQNRHTRLVLLFAALLLASAGGIRADETTTNAPPANAGASAKSEKPPPLPLHQIEGNGGIFATLSAYIVNPPRNGEPVGRPAVGFSYVDLDGVSIEPPRIGLWLREFQSGQFAVGCL